MLPDIDLNTAPPKSEFNVIASSDHIPLISFAKTGLAPSYENMQTPHFTIMRSDTLEGCVTKEEAEDLINNPTKLIGQRNCPYIINYRELVGDTFLEGEY